MNTLLLLSFLTVIFSCSEKEQKNPNNIPGKIESVMIGDTVSEIGKNIDCILQDKSGNYWFASNGDGLYRYDGKTLLHITEKHGLCSDFVLNIQEDRNGVLWFSTRDGFCSFNGSLFIRQTDNIQNAFFGKLNYTMGGIFFYHSKGICFYDGTNFTNFVIHPENYIPSVSDMNRPYSVYSFLGDKNGNVWFGTQSEGVCFYDGTTFSYLTDKNLAGPAVRTLFQDSKGNLWFGNNGGGLFRYHESALSNITEEKGLGNPEFLNGQPVDKPGSLARVWSINEDNEGNLWIGTIDAGLWKMEGTNLINYTTKEGLTGNAIWYIYKDNKGELWFVTNGDAICKFNGKEFERVKFE